MIMVICRFAHRFKIMRILRPIILFRALPQPVIDICCGSGEESNFPYIRCLDGRVPEAYELWSLAEDGFRKVNPYARVRLFENFREDTFHTHFSMHDDSRFPFWVSYP